MPFSLFAFGKNASGRDVRMSFGAGSLGTWLLGATDILAKTVWGNFGGQHFQDASQVRSGQSGEVLSPFHRRNGNHHPVVSRCQFTREVITRKVFASSAVSSQWVSRWRHAAAWVLGCHGLVAMRRCRLCHCR